MKEENSITCANKNVPNQTCTIKFEESRQLTMSKEESRNEGETTTNSKMSGKTRGKEDVRGYQLTHLQGINWQYTIGTNSPSTTGGLSHQFSVGGTHEVQEMRESSSSSYEEVSKKTKLVVKSKS